MKKIFTLGVFALLFVQCGQETRDKFTDISQELAPNNQEFRVDPTKDTLIECEKGTLIFLPANSIVLPDGTTPSEGITLNIQEYYSTKDLISRDLVTLSDSSLLVSGGMIDINAELGDEPCYIRNDRPFTLFFPRKNRENEQMQLFYNQSTEENDINWVKTPKEVFDLDNKALVPYEEDELLSCSAGWSDMIGIVGHGGHNDSIHEPDYSEFLNFTYENFVFTSEMTKYLCEHQDEYIGFWVEFDESAMIRDVEIFGDSTPFHNYTISFFDTITRSFDPNGPFDPISLSMHIAPNLESNNADYTYGFNEKYAEFKAAAMQNVDRAELNYYVMNSISFGLINCDYFYEDDTEKIDYFVKTDLIAHSKVYLAFEDINSMMIENSAIDGQFIFKNVPLGKRAKIVCINYSEDEPKMAIESVTLEESGVTLKDFKTFTLEELNQELTKL